jgi:hypothetical protein
MSTHYAITFPFPASLKPERLKQNHTTFSLSCWASIFPSIWFRRRVVVRRQFSNCPGAYWLLSNNKENKHWVASNPTREIVPCSFLPGGPTVKQ